MYSQQHSGLPLQGRPSGLPSAMDRQFQSRVDPRLLSQQMPQQVMQSNGGNNSYQHPMYGSNMRQQQQQQMNRQQTPQNLQQMSPQMAQQYQQHQAQLYAQQQQIQQQQMQQQAYIMANQQKQQMQQQATQFQQQQTTSNNTMRPGMLPANTPMPPTSYGGGPSTIPGGPEWIPQAQPNVDSQGNPITPEFLRAQKTSIHGSGQKINVDSYDQHEQYKRAKELRNLDPKNHVLFICPSRCPYSTAILEYLNNNKLIQNFTVIDLADPRIKAIPPFLTVIPTLYKPQERRKYTEDELKKWIITHFGNPTQPSKGFRTTEKTSTQITNMEGLRALGDITGDGNDIFTAMTEQGAPLSNDRNEYEVAHTTIMEGALSRFDDIDKGLNTMSFNDHSGGSLKALTGGSFTPGELRPSDKERMRDPNAPPLVQEPLNEPGRYIEGNPFAVQESSEARKNARKDEMAARYLQLQQERDKDIKMRPSQQQQNMQPPKTYTYLPR